MRRPSGLVAALFLSFVIVASTLTASADTALSSSTDLSDQARVRCSFQIYLRDVSPREVSPCKGPDPGCRLSCSGLSRAEEALNPNLPAGDLIVERASGMTAERGGGADNLPLEIPYSEKLAMWQSYRSQLESSGAIVVSRSATSTMGDAALQAKK